MNLGRSAVVVAILTAASPVVCSRSESPPLSAEEQARKRFMDTCLRPLIQAGVSGAYAQCERMYVRKQYGL